jgi:RNA polymerase sigma factor (sigma-70 family)
MMTNTVTGAPPQIADSELVARSAAGDRNAFGEIVARYQSLICSLGYSATGSLTQSEDLAQETFLAAWKQLCALREPAKLRPWLCGIARNIINDTFRRQGREPVHHADPLDPSHDSHACAAAPSEEAISREEESILWRSLESIPPLYREPFILFYREGQSVERVANALEISEDAVRQRLSRGRKLLQDQVSAFVEGALIRSVPGKAFTLAVLAALPGLTISAKATAVAATAVKGSATAKAAMTTGVLGAALTPFMSIAGAWIGYRLNLDSANSDIERRFVKRQYKRSAWLALALGVPLFVLLLFADKVSPRHPHLFASALVGIAIVWSSGFLVMASKQWKARRRLLRELDQAGLRHTAKPVREHLSSISFLGLPLYHIRIGSGLAAQSNVVKAWIAVGDMAVGGLFAFGGCAIAPISIGGFAIGLFSFGGCGIGFLTLGGFALGWWAFGAFGIGYFSFSACALALKAASGGVALARDFALGGFAQATEANSQPAKDFLFAQPFFRAGYAMLPYLFLMNLLWLAPLFQWWRVVKKATPAGTRSS